jgi:hypothetical protein
MWTAATLALGIIGTGTAIRADAQLSQSPRATVSTNAISTRLAPAQLRMMNYFPAQHGWGQMWANYSPSQADADFAAIHGLGANAVRLIIQPSAMGWPVISTNAAINLQDAITRAASHGLSVQLTLFDLWGLYDSVQNSKTWLNSLLGSYAGDPRIALVELQNEIDPTNPVAMAWARTMLGYLATVLPGTPRTLSVRGLNNGSNVRQLLTSIPPSLLDVVDLHLYGSLSGDAQILQVAKAYAGRRPIIVGEGGQSTATAQSQASDFTQAKYLASLDTLVNQFGIASFAPWTLNDLTPSALRAHMSASQKFFGLRRTDGSWKPAAAVVRQMFSAQAANETLSANGRPLQDSQLADGKLTSEARPARGASSLGYWSLANDQFVGHYGLTGSGGVQGSHQIYLIGTGGTSSRVPAFEQEFPTVSCAKASLSVYVRLSGATGSTRASIAWFNNLSYLGQTESPMLSNANTGWQHITLNSAKLAGATTMQVHLKSQGNAGTAAFSDIAVTCR